MTNEQLLKYFENRPSLDEIYLVDKVVFVDKDTADRYAAQVKSKVNTKQRKDAENAFAQEKLNLPKLTKDEAKIKLKSMKLGKSSDYNELSALVDALGLQVESDSKKAYLAALKVAQEGLLPKTNERAVDVKTETSKA